MEASETATNPVDFPLDILGQQPRINRLYTQITFCYAIPDDSPQVKSRLTEVLSDGFRKLSTAIPWVAGKVVQEHGSFTIKPSEKAPGITVRELRDDPSISTWDALRKAQFPFSMLDESVIAPAKTLVDSDGSASGLRVFLIQANFIAGGLLLTINGQHGSMDMAGQSQVIHLLAKACRGEPFDETELSVGNMSRKGLVPILDSSVAMGADSQGSSEQQGGGSKEVKPQSSPSDLVWAYFIFSGASVAALKSLAGKTVPAGTFASTDDVLSAFVWQSITRARIPRLNDATASRSTLSRNVDVRRSLSIPPTYPGLITNSTIHTSAVDSLDTEPLGSLAVQLRAALDQDKLRDSTVALATRISRGENVSFASASSPGLDVRLSSWAKEKSYDVDFGFGFGIGKPDAVRRPKFQNGAREGLVYFLPKTLDGEIAVGICLREEDMERLRKDEEFVKFGNYVG